MAHTTTPVWTSLFNIARAAITEVGGLFRMQLSWPGNLAFLVNGAIDATRMIVDGTPILVDGSSGFAEL